MSTKRLPVNITLERIARIIVGLVAAIAAALLLRDAGSGATVALEVLLALSAGLPDLAVTGATGHCYCKKLGHVPAS